MGESPLDKGKLQTLKRFIPEKKKKLKKLVKRKLEFLSPNSDANAIDTSEDDEHEATKKKLSNACAQWGNRKVRRKFNCLHRLVSHA